MFSNSCKPFSKVNIIIKEVPDNFYDEYERIELFDSNYREWQEYPGYSRYLFSNMGEVWNGKKFLSTPVYGKYRIVGLYGDCGHRHTIHLHTIIAKLFRSNNSVSTQTQVHHINHDKLDNRAANLAWVSPERNMHWAKKAGRLVEGSKHHLSKLTEKKAMEIFNDPRMNIEIAPEYNVDPSTVSGIKNRQIWKHIHLRGSWKTQISNLN